MAGAVRHFNSKLNLAVTPCSCFLPFSQRQQFVSDCLQPLKSAFLIRCAGCLLAASQVLAIRFTDLRYFFPQFCDALLDGPRHGDRLAEDAAQITVANSVLARTSQTSSFYPSVRRIAAPYHVGVHCSNMLALPICCAG
jgi:hypothetical protein